MASAIDTAKADAPQRRQAPGRGWRFPGSRLGGLILALNLLSLLILLGGALTLNEWRSNLVEARLESLTSQAQLLAELLSDGGVTAGDPQPTLNPLLASEALLDVFIPQGQRARIFDGDGFQIADSYVVSSRIDGEPLPPALPADAPPPKAADGVTRSETRRAQADAELYMEVAAALEGQPQSSLRRNELGDRVVSVSIPIRHVQAVLGVLTIEAGDVDETLAAQRRALIPFALVAVAVTLLTSLLIHLFVARPILRLSSAADHVRMQRSRAISLPDLEDRKDEIGNLARSLETMTATLSDRMDAIEAFAADVSHEIKNPLTSIRSALETLDLIEDPEKKARLIAVVQADVRRLDRLITDISNASRLDAELSRDAPRPVDLSKLLGEIVTVYETTSKPGEAPVRLIDRLEPSPKGGRPRGVVVGRETPLGQVFRNLIDNARSFSPPGRPVAVILERAEGEALPIRVRVEDEGPGVPPENLETVFERFYTSRPKGTKFGGNSGLGLSITRQIVEAHDGRVIAENRTGPDGGVTGARFTVALPEPR
ncbi:sensor histidine kinase [Brevundimonas lutea]|uniref:sensor histidine kinase n=1 Tax=Brevundimonas lutea TaxID=2293980 RepID=UPI000F02E034|nr:ATP-binding protein [Brevundimonas lutea]